MGQAPTLPDLQLTVRYLGNYSVLEHSTVRLRHSHYWSRYRVGLTSCRQSNASRLGLKYQARLGILYLAIRTSQGQKNSISISPSPSLICHRKRSARIRRLCLNHQLGAN